MILWAWKFCPKVLLQCGFPEHPELDPRDDGVARDSLYLVMFYYDDSWNKNHNSELWNKDGFLLSTSFITVHYSKPRKTTLIFFKKI